MCGIFGMIGPGADRDLVNRALMVQDHRGPDFRQSVVLAGRQVVLGHNRLSIIDTSEAGHQPMQDVSGQCWIVFNGEIYNHKELRRELTDYPFRSQSDTEVILAAYLMWGEACLDRFIGMFAFALWDGRSGRLFCARDRVGIKPFHHAQLGDTFVFGSEIKPILSTGVDARPDMDSWARYLNQGVYEQGDKTFFANIQQLSAGHTLSLSPGHPIPKPRKFWDLKRIAEQAEAKGNGSVPDEELLSVMKDAVSIRLRSDVPLGINLSGGLDSYLLSLMVEENTHATQPLFAATAGFEHPDYDEREFARQLINHKRWSQLETAEAWSMVPKVTPRAIRYQEAPLGGVSTLGYHNLHKKIRQSGLIVQLEGQGLDELFAGYAYYRKMALGQTHFDAWMSENTYQDGTSPLAQEVLAPDIRSYSLQHDDFDYPDLQDDVNKALYVDITQKKIPRVLRMNDRLSMASSIELREPFLDHRLIEMSFRMSGKEKVGDGIGKVPLRRLANQLRPTSPFINQPKRAVVAPQTVWFRNELQQYVRDRINSPYFLETGLVDADKVRQRFNSFVEHGAANSFFIWQWVNVSIWFETFTDGNWRADIPA